MENIVLKGISREASGKGPARQLRMKGLIPGVFYFKNEDSSSLYFDKREFYLLIKQNPSLITLEVEGKKDRECIIRDLQRDPISEEIIHVDLLGIKRGQKLRVSVPIKLLGIPEGVKTGGGILQQVLSEVEIECLPKDIPSSIPVNVEDLEIGKGIHIGALDFPELKFLADISIVIASVVEPSLKHEEVEEEIEEGEEGEEGEETTEETESKE